MFAFETFVRTCMRRRKCSCVGASCTRGSYEHLPIDTLWRSNMEVRLYCYYLLWYLPVTIFSASCHYVCRHTCKWWVGRWLGKFKDIVETRDWKTTDLSVRASQLREMHIQRFTSKQPCVLQHRECKWTAPRRGWKTINTQVKNTSLNTFGCRKCMCVCTVTVTGQLRYRLVQHACMDPATYPVYVDTDCCLV